jgi:beta-lactamase regulating signal transducer with metallopeptidase domain
MSFLPEQTVLARLLFASVEVVALALLAAALLRWLRPSPRIAALCWAAVLVKPLVSLAIGSPIVLWELERPAAAAVERAPAVARLPSALRCVPDPVLAESEPVAPRPTNVGVAASNTTHPSASIDSVASETVSAPAQRRLPSTTAILLCAWSVGVALMLLRGARDRLRLRWLLLRCTPAPAELRALARRVASPLGLRTLPELRVSSSLPSPACVGVVRPAVLLPEWMLEAPHRALLLWSLRHELVHFKRWDGALLFLRELALTAFFFHPVIWWVARRLELSLELACDAEIVRSPRQAQVYAERLLAIRELARGERSLALAAFVVRTKLHERIRALVREPTRRATRRVIAMRGLPALLILASFVGARSQQEPTQEAPAGDAATKPASPNGRSLRGRVVDADSKPFADAEVRLIRARIEAAFDDRAAHFVELARARTDRDGHFTLADVAPQSTEEWYSLVVKAPGHVPTWKSARDLAALDDATLELPQADCPIEGRLIDLEGRPIAGATIRVQGIQRIEGIAIEEFDRRMISDVSQSSIAPFLQHRIEPADELPTELRSDETGRFQIRGAAPDCRVSLDVHAPGFEFTFLTVVTHPGLDTAPHLSAAERAMQETMEEFGNAPNAPHGPVFTHALAPEQRIAGVVVDAATGQPIADCTVFEAPIQGLCDDRTDESGRFELRNLPRRKRAHYVGVRGPSGSDWLPTLVEVLPEPTLAPIEVRIEVRRGVLVRGRVTDPTTGAGVPCRVDFMPYPENPNARAAKWGITASTSGLDGRYSIAVLPGPGVLTIAAGGDVHFCTARPKDFQRKPGRSGYVTFGGGEMPASFFNEVRYLDLAAGSKPQTIDVALRRGHALELRITDSAGLPVPRCLVFGITANSISYEPIEGARVGLVALDSEEKRRVFVLAPESRGARVLDLTGEESGTLEVKLEPCGWIVARLLDDEGKPCANRSIDCYFRRTDSEYFSCSAPILRADSNGVLRAAIVPGLKYSFQLKEQVELTLEPDEVKDLGEVRLADEAMSGS